MRGVVVVAALLFAPQPASPLAPLQFLVGTWRAIDTPAGERGSFTFAFAAQNHVLVRKNEAVYDATPSHPASRHDDVMIVFAENGAIKADDVDSEGHVIRYTVTVDANRATFVSDKDPKGPRYRLTYTAGADGVLVGSFEIAASDAPDAFKPYLSWRAKKEGA